MEVILGPETGKCTSPVQLSPDLTSYIAIGRNKKFVNGKAMEETTSRGLLLALDLDVSSKHAQVLINVQCGHICIRDCNSTNGTKVNDVAIIPDDLRQLKDGDVITVGKSMLVYRVHERCNVCTDQSPAVQPIASESVPSVLVDDFEVIPTQQPRPTNDCFVCGESLWGMGTMSRELHVNQCLDKKPHRGKQTKSVEKEQINLAIAMSKSIINEEMECSVSRSIIESQIQDIDNQIVKLQKQREKLMRSLKKVKKQTKKVAASTLLPPQVVVDWDKNAQLAQLFPPLRQRYTVHSLQSSTRKMALLWLKAAQLNFDDEEDYLVPCFSQYLSIPPTLVTVFPNWEENLTFLESSTQESVQAALERLQAEKAHINQLDPKWSAFSFFERRMKRLIRQHQSTTKLAEVVAVE